MPLPELARRPVTVRLAAAVLGALSVLAFAPFGCFPLAWLGAGGLFLLLAHVADTTSDARQGALLGGTFGLAFFLAGVSWVYVSLHRFGGMLPPLAALLTLLFCAFLALYPALAGAIFVRHAPTRWWLRALFFATLGTLGEWLRGWIFTGFPWLAMGYSQTPPSPLAGAAPVLGVFGVSLLTLLLGALLATACTRRARRCWPPLLTALLLLAGTALLGQVGWTTADGTALRVALLQGNVAQDMKWRPERFRETLRTYYELARDHPAQLTIMPETALPSFLDQVPPDYLDALTALAGRQQGNLLFGVVVGADETYANGAVALGADGEQYYRKSHLVPFGEFIPPGFSWFLRLASIPMSSFTPGAAEQPPLRLSGQLAAVDICYEDAFGEEIRRALPSATVLINMSNVAWFGDSLAPAQHLQIARLRALESGRTMLRATNTGMTAIVEADGSVRRTLPPFTRGALVDEISGRHGATPFVRWGNTPVVVFCLLLIAAIVVRARRRPRPAHCVSSLETRS